MEPHAARLYDALEGAALACGSRCVALSGGLDSSALAYLLRGRRPRAVAVVADDFASPDLAYCQLAARSLGLPLDMVRAGTAEVLDAAGEAVRILRSFNDIEVRNAAVMYLAIRRARDAGERGIVTGDGADELLAGYSFLLRMGEAELDAELARLRGSMRFASHAIGRDLGVRVESPFLSPAVAGLAASIPAGLKVRGEGAARAGKWVLRAAFEGRLPGSVVWRPKCAMQDGAGTAGLAGLLDAVVPDADFEAAREEARRADGVALRTKESAHYYRAYRRLYGPPEPGEGRRCPYCRSGLAGGARYCRACGAHPV